MMKNAAVDKGDILRPVSRCMGAEGMPDLVLFV